MRINKITLQDRKTVAFNENLNAERPLIKPENSSDVSFQGGNGFWSKIADKLQHLKARYIEKFGTGNEVSKKISNELAIPEETEITTFENGVFTRTTTKRNGTKVIEKSFVDGDTAITIIRNPNMSDFIRTSVGGKRFKDELTGPSGRALFSKSYV